MRLTNVILFLTAEEMASASEFRSINKFYVFVTILSIINLFLRFEMMGELSSFAMHTSSRITKSFHTEN